MTDAPSVPPHPSTPRETAPQQMTVTGLFHAT